MFQDFNELLSIFNAHSVKYLFVGTTPSPSTRSLAPLTVKGKAEAIVQDAGAYQRLLDIAARADAGEGIRQGLHQSRQGQGRDAEEFFAEFEAAHGISR